MVQINFLPYIHIPSLPLQIHFRQSSSSQYAYLRTPQGIPKFASTNHNTSTTKTVIGNCTISHHNPIYPYLKVEKKQNSSNSTPQCVHEFSQVFFKHHLSKSIGNKISNIVTKQYWHGRIRLVHVIIKK